MTAAEFLQQLRQRVDFPLFDDERIRQWRRTPAARHAHIGVAAQVDDRCTVGAVPALGRLDGVQLKGVARIAEQYGDAVLHLTPWQSILLPDIDVMHVDQVLPQLRAIGFHVDSGDPLAHLVACSGASGCAKGLADTKADALQLARLVDGVPAPLMDVHLTGCSRSCACAHVAPFTLLATGAAQYDLYCRADGNRSFGARIASNIDIHDAAQFLRQFSRSENLQ
jgi:precorrin-3B synthase